MNDLIDIIAYGCDNARKIQAIKFVRAVVLARDGAPCPLLDAKEAVDDLLKGSVPRIIIERVPKHLHSLIVSSAEQCQVQLLPPEEHGYPRYI